ncbi:MAG: hypothetical protein HQ461_04500 [Deltaproteobacteria bacterium]|nr:hypothetical protein [Deltaproteobacteria bacterium]
MTKPRKSPSLLGPEVPPLAAYRGPVEGMLRSNDSEILRELLGVIEATRDKNIKLTKSGIPPKPLWSAINERLLWQDPKSVLYDWDEVDQVRFVYSLAEHLMLVHRGQERVLGVGPGADQFFLALPTRRAEMLMRAYMATEAWDERCDARNEQGHRHNFGQTFRRDFLRSILALREVLIAVVATTPVDEWVMAASLATSISAAEPAMLISEDDEVPEVEEGEADPEIRRLVDYWLLLAARFGWVDLGRAPTARGVERVWRLTEMGARLIQTPGKLNEDAETVFADARKPYIIQSNHEVMFYRHEGDVGDEYFLRRIGEPVDNHASWDGPIFRARVTAATLLTALESGMDATLLRTNLIERTRADIPASFHLLIADAQRKVADITLTEGLTAVELAGASAKKIPALTKAGFAIFGDLAIVPWSRWADFVRISGEDPTEGFRYPPDDSLANFDGNRLELVWPVLPLMVRDLLDQLPLAGDPPSVELTEAMVADLTRKGWVPRAVAEALDVLTDGRLPKWLAAEVKSSSSAP